MKNMTNNLMVLLTALVCLVMVLVSVFAPRLVLPEFGFPLILAITLAALVLEAYLPVKQDSPLLLSLLMSGLCFSLLPWSAGLAEVTELPRLFILGLAAWAIIAPVFHAMTRRLHSDTLGSFAPVGNAFVLYLAAQGLVGLL